MNGAWTYKGRDSEGAGSNGVAGQEDAEIPEPTTAPMIPFVALAPQQEPMSSFERLMIYRMDSMTEEQRSHHEYCVTHFTQLHQQIDDIHNTLNNFNL